MAKHSYWALLVRLSVHNFPDGGHRWGHVILGKLEWWRRISLDLWSEGARKWGCRFFVCLFVFLCQWDQNEIKWSMFFLRADQGTKMNSEQLRLIDQYIFSDAKDAWIYTFLSFEHQAIKRFRRELSSNQGWFSLIKTLDPSCKCFYEWYVWGAINIFVSKLKFHGYLANLQVFRETHTDI